MKYKRIIRTLTLMTALIITGCGAASQGGEEMDEPEVQIEDLTNVINIDESKTYQTWEGFGASSCWWSQYVGGWDEPYKEGDLPVREQIAQYLYSRDQGIGLTIYRYNVGAGSADSYLGDISDKNRRAQSFIGVDGNYNWDKDEMQYGL